MQPGATIGPYVVQGALGRGTMGLVLRVVHPGLGHTYALKVLAPEVAQDKDALRRFQREMEALARVDGHPGIVRVHSAGVTPEGSPYYAMELVEGEPLSRALRRGLPLEEGLAALAQIAAALGHAHARGLVHRDVKPENILLGHDGQARLADFGLARALRGDDRMTRTGDLVGTPTHLAPEQAVPALGEVGPWSDVWALGVVLYELLTGALPYDGKTAIEVYTKVYEGAPIAPPRAVRPEVDRALEGVCLRALTRNPNARHPHGAAFLEDLERARAAGADEPTGRGLVRALAAAALVAVFAAVGAIAAVVARGRAAEARRAEAAAAAARAADEVRALVVRGDLERAAATADERRAALGDLAPGQARPLDEARAEARRAAAQRAWRDGRAADARAHLDALAAGPPPAGSGPGAPRAQAGPPRDDAATLPERAWILAVTGDAGAALAALPPDAPAAVRARIAAWAGDAAAATAALAAVTPPARGRALHWALWRACPGLAPPAESDLEREEEAGAWGHVARGEEALARGLVAAAARAFGAAQAAATAPGQEGALERRARLGLARVELARGRPGPAATAVVAALRGEDDPLARLDALELAALVARAGAGPAGWPPAELVAACGGDPALVLARAAPAAPPAVGAGVAAPDARATGVAEARRRAAAGDPAAGEGLAPPEGGWPPGAPRAFCEAERAACALGQDGAAGLLVARGAELAAAAERGGDLPAARAALELLDVAARARPDSPAALVARARALRLAREPVAALEAARRAAALAPADPTPRLEEARALLAQVDPAALEADLARLERKPNPALEARVAQGLEAAAAAFEAARALALPGDACDDEARLGLARARLDLAWRRRGDAGAPVRADAATTAAALDALGPLLARLDAAAVARARLAWGEALADGADDGALAPLELDLARAAGVGPSPDLAALEAARLRAALPDGEAHLAAWWAVAGDLPARALLLARRAERAPGPEARRLLEQAGALAPWVPHVGFERELAQGLGRDAEALDALGRLLALDAGRTLVVADALGLAPAPAASPSSALGRALATLCRPAGGGARAGTAADRARRARWATEHLAARPDDPAAHLLRALEPPPEPGRLPVALADRAAEPDVLHDLRCAAAAGADGPAALLERAVARGEPLARLVDRALALGHPIDAVLEGPAREQVAARLEPLREHLDALDLDRSWQVLGLARGLGQRSPELAVSLRLVVPWRRRDQGDGIGTESMNALLAAIGAHDPARAAGARALYWRLRAEGDLGDDERREAQDEAARAARRALDAARAPGRPPGATLALLTAPGARRRTPPPGRHDAEAIARGLPRAQALADVWGDARRPARALEWLAWTRGVRADDGHGRALTDLLDPLGRGQAWTLGVQSPSLEDLPEALAATAPLREALLACERALAFRQELGDEVAYWAGLYHLRYRLAAEPDPAQRAAGRRRALAWVGRAREVAARPEPMRALASDLALDLAADLAADDPARAGLLERARQDAEATRPAQFPDTLASQATAWWRAGRARLLAGDEPGAREALARVGEAVRADDDWGLSEMLEKDPHREALLAAHPWLREPLRRALRDRERGARGEDDGAGEAEGEGADAPAGGDGEDAPPGGDGDR